MSLVKWLRKNNRKLMAVFVVAIMLAFVMPTVLQQLSRPSGAKATIAYFEPDGKITNKDILDTRWQLNLLQALLAKQFLLRQQDFRLILLSELLFHDTGTSAAVSRQINSTVITKQWRTSSREIDNLFSQVKGGNELSPIFWLLLKAEAKQAGIMVSTEFASQVLSSTISQLTEGQLNAKQLVQRIVEQRGISEETVLETFRHLLGIVVYAQAITSNENITASQLMYMVNRNTEKIDVEFVNFDSSLFTQSEPEPTPAELNKHFEKYRKFFPGQITPQNPYGFGYKIPEIVQLEYIAVKLDDVTTLVEAPGPEQAEEFYQKHRKEFIANVPLDPNDPNSETIERIKTYAEIADDISTKLLQDRVRVKAETILNEAIMLTEADLEDVQQPAQISDEQFKELAGDYGQAAEQLSKKHNIKIHTGRTGLLTAEELMWDRHLGMFYLEGQNLNPISLTKIVFAIEQLDASHLGPYEVPRPRMYENIGPINNFFDKTMALLRVIHAEKPTEPTDINYISDKTGLEFLEKSQDEDTQKTQPLKELVEEDLKKLKAMATARSVAEQFLKLAQAGDWDEVIEEFNNRYAPKDKQKDLTQQTIKLQNFTELRRISNQNIAVTRLNNDDSAAARSSLHQHIKSQNLIDRFFALLPEGKTSPEKLPLIMELKSQTSFYVIKNISRKLTSREEYEREKIISAYREDTGQSQSLAVIHFTPENIIKRMKFRWAGAKQSDDKQATAEPNGAEQ